MSKKIISVLLVFTLVFSASSSAFADSNNEPYDNDDPVVIYNQEDLDAPNSSDWTSWKVVGTTKTNSVIEGIATSVVYSMLISAMIGYSFTGVDAIISAITGTMSVGDTVYYKTVKYRRYSKNNDGRFQQKQIRFVYSSSKRDEAHKIGTIKGSIVTYNSSPKSIEEGE